MDTIENKNNFPFPTYLIGFNREQVLYHVPLSGYYVRSESKGMIDLLMRRGQSQQ